MPTTGRERRTASRRRHPNWRLPPLSIEPSSCINCGACMKACPAEFGAVVARRFAYAIVPELCSGCALCVPVCPVDCITPDPYWTPAPAAWWGDVRMDQHV